MSIVTAIAPKSSRILFNACDKIAPRNPRFGAGLAKPRPIKTVGYTVADAAWWAEQNTDGATDAEVSDFRDMVTMSRADYRALVEEIRQVGQDAYDRRLEEQEADSAMQDRMEALPARQTQTIFRGEDGTAMAVVMDRADATNLEAATFRANAILGEFGAMPHAAWICRLNGTYRMLDRDTTAKGLAFCGSTPIRREALEGAFGVRLPH